MNASDSRTEKWRRRLRRVRALARKALPFVSGVVAVLVALLLYNLVVPPPHQITQNDVNNSVAAAMASATPPPAFSSLVYQAIQPSLVLVQAKGLSGKGNLPSSFQHDGAHDTVLTRLRVQDDNTTGVGAGVIIDDGGDILTSLHVVQNAADIEVTFADGTQSSAKITGAQTENDIAVLQASQPPAIIIPATLGNPNAMRVGDEAYVVGSPFGLYDSMSTGVISGFERTLVVNSSLTLQHLIQVDASINPGNAGGPLLNRDGQVIGIVVGLLNPTNQNVFIGIGYAVTITTAGGAAGLPPD